MSTLFLLLEKLARFTISFFMKIKISQMATTKYHLKLDFLNILSVKKINHFVSLL